MVTTRQIIDILLIEDDPNDAELAVRELKKHNLINNIIHLKNGDDAINYFFEGNNIKDCDFPKIILLDLKLPKIPGSEVLRQLKSNVNTKNIPVIVMTSSKENRDLQECYSLGANSYIVKPVEFDSFAKVVKEVGLYWMITNTPHISFRH